MVGYVGVVIFYVFLDVQQYYVDFFEGLVCMLGQGQCYVGGIVDGFVGGYFIGLLG